MVSWQFGMRLLVYVLVVFFSASVMASESDLSATLNSGRLKLVFDVSDGKVFLTSLRTGDGYEWLSGSAPEFSIWQAAFESADGTIKEVASRDLILAAMRTSANKTTFTWNVPLKTEAAVVNVSIRCPKGSRLAYWSLAARLPKDWRVIRCDFPLVISTRLNGLKLAAPSGWGIEYHLVPGTKYEASYPSCQASMQFIALYRRGRGLYIGAHDPQGNHKYFNVSATDDRVGYLCMNWPSIHEKTGGAYSVPYEMAIGVFDGDYWDAAQIYREFTFQAQWGQVGSLSRRSMPRWVKELDLWLFSELPVEENLKLYRQATDFFSIPIGFHWYRWHEIPHDVGYPDYFPAKPGFQQVVKEIQAAGWYVMPYINGRCADRNSRWWAEHGGASAAATQANGEGYLEEYVKGHPLNVMCPAARVWQETIAGLTKRLFQEVSVNGVYIDQIGAAAPVRCFDTKHGHKPGGGTLWADGYRELLKRVRQSVASEGIIATEENAECWIDQIDLQLMANTPTTTGQEPIPLFTSVYSGRSLTYGYQYPAWDDIIKSVPFRAKMARSFVWGAQPGWVRLRDITRPEASKEAEFLRNLARTRRFGHQFLVYGRFLGMINVRGDNPRLICKDALGSFGGSYEIDLPSVLASAWQAEDGSLGIVLANMSDGSRSVEFDLPVVCAGLSMSAPLKRKIFGPEGLLSSGTITEARQRVEIPARSGAILSIND